jgi:hypothetical protein
LTPSRRLAVFCCFPLPSDCPKYTITAVSTDKDSTVIADGTTNLGTGHIKVTLSPALVGATVTFSYSKPGVECKLDAGSQTDYTCTGLPIGDTTISIKACKDGGQQRSFKALL